MQTIRDVTDGVGTLVTRNDYDPYGRTTRVGGTEDSRLAFTGHQMHVPTGLALALYRQYDGTIGRLLSRDPIGLAGQDVNLYAYVWNAPVRYRDPFGLEVKNRTDRSVVVKPEEGTPGIVPPNQTYPGKIDGVLGPDGKWIKFSGKWWLPDNKVEVGDDGQPKCVGGLCRVLPPSILEGDPDSTWKVPADPKPLPGCRPNKR